MIIEACVPSVESALAAQRGGADRIELCENLVEGGTTPSAGTLMTARRHLHIPIMAMIRPRGGDFNYTDLEVEIMLRDIEIARATGADGVVFGALATDGSIDLETTDRLVGAAGDLPVTFHRAFDVCRDPFEALESLIRLGVRRILTSGQRSSALEGLELIRELIATADGRIGILPGGGIDASNAPEITSVKGVDELHVYSAEDFPSPMTHRNEVVTMGRAYTPEEYVRTEVCEAGIRSIVNAVT